MCTGIWKIAQGDRNPDGERVNGRQPRGGAAHGQEIKEGADRNGSRDGRQDRAA